MRIVLAFALLTLGVLVVAVAAAALTREPAVTIRNGPLEGWHVVRDDETLLCEDPIVFVQARQIECP